MTDPHFPTLSGSVEFAFYPLQQVDRWNPIEVKMESGHVEIRPRWTKPRRQWRWIGTAHYPADIDKVMAFLSDRKGGGNFFYIDNNVIPIWSPYDAPTLGATTSGAMPEHTQYIALAYSDGTNTTNVSQESSSTVAANDLLTVTSPRFPTGVTECRIYAGTVSGTLYFIGTESDDAGTWTEPFSTVDADSADAQKVLNVAATTNFESGQSVIIGEGTAREEVKVIDTVQAGVSLTMVTNLTYTHTAVQADEVYIDYDSGTAAPTSNTLVGEEVKVRLLGEPSPMLKGGVYSLTLDLEEMF